MEQDLSDKAYRALLNLTHAWGVEQGVNYALDNCKVDALVLPAWTDMSIFAAWSGKSRWGTPTAELKTHRNSNRDCALRYLRVRKTVWAGLRSQKIRR